jgi:hypothetical protein
MDTGHLRTNDLQRVPPALRPEDPAPSANAPYEQRADWSERYVAWFIAHTPQPREALPSDVEPTHRYEVEFNSCVLDPQRYELQTQAELTPHVLH